MGITQSWSFAQGVSQLNPRNFIERPHFRVDNKGQMDTKPTTEAVNGEEVVKEQCAICLHDIARGQEAQVLPCLHYYWYGKGSILRRCDVLSSASMRVQIPGFLNSALASVRPLFPPPFR